MTRPTTAAISSVRARPASGAAATAGPGCTKVLDCLGDCGQTGHGCQGVGCKCCQLHRYNCTDNPQHLCNGVPVQRASEIKFCQFADVDCPSRTDPCLCTTPCS